ncbi:MAG TPA: DUF1616 domain-containing protein [Ktedonobacteraceae bacterium]|nr:DUF1616 domain-containing protein [Ktedonobacteraceae bacterium]
MRLKHPDLMLATAIALLNVVLVLLAGRATTGVASTGMVWTSVIGTILALPLVFVLPGYTLCEALFHKRSLDAVHRMLISLGLSLSIDILGGIVLNVFPIGLRALSWAALLAFLTALFALLVAYLRRKTVMIVKQPHRIRFNAYECILFGLACAVVMLSIGFSAASVAQQPRPGFTQMWMLPSDQSNNSCAVRLGVRSYELSPVTFSVEMTINGAQVNRWPSIVLAPQQEWERLVSIGSSETGAVSIEAQLYRSGKPQVVYRQVNITMYSARCVTEPGRGP